MLCKPIISRLWAYRVAIPDRVGPIRELGAPLLHIDHRGPPHRQWRLPLVVLRCLCTGDRNRCAARRSAIARSPWRPRRCVHTLRRLCHVGEVLLICSAARLRSRYPVLGISLKALVGEWAQLRRCTGTSRLTCRRIQLLAHSVWPPICWHVWGQNSLLADVRSGELRMS